MLNRPGSCVWMLRFRDQAAEKTEATEANSRATYGSGVVFGDMLALCYIFEGSVEYFLPDPRCAHPRSMAFF
jgi:hypothetical protein